MPVFLSFALGIGSFCLPVSPVTAVSVPPSGLTAGEVLADALAGSCDRVDLTPFRLPVSDLPDLYASVLHTHPELFHVQPRLSYTRLPDNTVGVILPAYSLTGSALRDARKQYRDTLRTVSEEWEAAQADRRFSEAESALFLHDWLAKRCDYDLTGQNADAFSLFRDGTGICQAYALAFLALSGEIGLTARFIRSDDMDHAWNLVRIDGVFYHVDVTRDDPVGEKRLVRHGRFLRSDRGMEELGYTGFRETAPAVCPDSRFERDVSDSRSDETLPDGRMRTGLLEAFDTPLVPTRNGFVGRIGDELTAVYVRESDPLAPPLTVGTPGDTDADGRLTPSDLLTVLDTDCPAEWVGLLRRQLLGQATAG